MTLGQGPVPDIRGCLAAAQKGPLLFYGPDPAGQKALALEIAKALNCLSSPLTLPRPPLTGPAHVKGRLFMGGPSPAEGRGMLFKNSSPLVGEDEGEGAPPCNLCLPCRKIAAGTHPDVQVINLAVQAVLRNEAEERQQNLRIETVQHERRRLLQKPLEGQWKVSILDEAHRLTADAANVLLKILEEPPPQTLIVLMTAFRDRLLPTVVSRCLPIRLKAADRISVIARSVATKQSPEIATLPSVARNDRKARRLTRAEAEAQVQDWLAATAEEMRQGSPEAERACGILLKAYTQLKQNANPQLVMDVLRAKLGDRPEGPVPTPRR